MDKYEYRVRADEIKGLIEQGEYAQAAEIADSIDWRRVKSVMMLCTISDLYKMNRRYEDARDMLLLAYERRPGGRTICYSLCELSIKTEEFVQAVEYYKEFVQVAPKDPGRYVLQYKLYEAQDVSLEERIAVLEELKKRDYREKWAYELAYLYHRVGLATRCVEECDELILWFGEGKYVVKAMELKMLHEPLSPDQQMRYDRRFETTSEADAQELGEAPPGGDTEETEDAADYGRTQEYYPGYRNNSAQQSYYGEEAYLEDEASGENIPEYMEAEGDYSTEAGSSELPSEDMSEEELDIRVKTVDVGEYNTLNLQAELAAGLKEVLGEEPKAERDEAITRAIVAPMLEDTESLDYPQIEEVDEEDLLPETEPEEMEGSEVFFGETGEIGVVASQMMAQKASARVEAAGRPDSLATEREPEEAGDSTAEIVMEELRQENIQQKEREEAARQAMIAEPPKGLAQVLAQEADGQLSLVVPDDAHVEKQITGQMNIEDILMEWERMKEANRERRKEEVRQHVLAQTGNMFTEFEAAVRDGLLEQLEKDAAIHRHPEGQSGENGNVGALQTGPEDAESVAGALAGSEQTAEQETASDPEVSGILEIEKGYMEESGSAGETPESEGERQPEHAVEMSGAVCEEEPEYTEEHPQAEYEVQPEYAVEMSGAVCEEETEYIGEQYEERSGYVETAPVSAYEEQSETVYGEESEAEYEEQSEYAAEQSKAGYGEEPEYTGEQQSIAYEESGYTGEMQQPVYEEQAAYHGEAAGQTYGNTAGDEGNSHRMDPEQIHDRESEEPLRESIEGEAVLPGEEDPADISRDELPERDKPTVRALTREERELFAPFIQSKSAREQLVNAIDNISMAAYTGNVIITGEEGMDTLTLAKNLVREVKMTDSNFSGKVAKISGRSLANRSVRNTVEQLPNGALIIQNASAMTGEAAEELYGALQQEKQGIIVILEDIKKAMDRFLERNPELAACFNARMDVAALSNDTLVAFGRQYAREMEYSIDEFGILALHTKIEERQTIDHVVTVVEVKKMVDDAIRHANRKSIGHFFDVLLAKRYDEEDMIILGEKDFT